VATDNHLAIQYYLCHVRTPRYDWKHGINVNHRNHPLPRHDSMNPLLFTAWNAAKCCRAVIFQSNKVFSDLSLQLEYERAVLVGDTEAVSMLGTTSHCSQQISTARPCNVAAWQESDTQAQKRTKFCLAISGSSRVTNTSK
jgi:hypothetical protein